MLIEHRLDNLELRSCVARLSAPVFHPCLLLRIGDPCFLCRIGSVSLGLSGRRHECDLITRSHLVQQSSSARSIRQLGGEAGHEVKWRAHKKRAICRLLLLLLPRALIVRIGGTPLRVIRRRILKPLLRDLVLVPLMTGDAAADRA